jgi:hypothetical protein
MINAMMVVKIGVAEDKIGVDNADADVADVAAALFFVFEEFAAIIVYIDKIYKPNPGFILL